MSSDTRRRSAYYVAAMALHAAEDKTFRGASVAGFATPWGWLPMSRCRAEPSIMRSPATGVITATATFGRLIYRKPDAGTLELVRLGSHSELGL